MIRIYLTDLAAYNCGALVGKWITLPLTNEQLQIKISEVLSLGEMAINTKDHEEWFITDYEWEDIDLFTQEEDTKQANLTSSMQKTKR